MEASPAFEPKICDQCCQIFTPRHAQQQRCGQKCSRLAEQKRDRLRRAKSKLKRMAYSKQCTRCQRDFRPTHAHTRYCSRECYNASREPGHVQWRRDLETRAITADRVVVFVTRHGPGTLHEVLRKAGAFDLGAASRAPMQHIKRSFRRMEWGENIIERDGVYQSLVSICDVCDGRSWRPRTEEDPLKPCEKCEGRGWLK